MRIKPFITVLAACVSLCSCSSQSSAKPCELDEKFSSQVKITNGERNYTATLTRADAQIWQMEFTAPETIAGLRLGFTGDVCTLEMQGLKYELDRKSVPQWSCASLCCGALEEMIAKRGVSCTAQGDTVTEKGSVNGHDFTAQFEDGKIKELTFSDQLKCEF